MTRFNLTGTAEGRLPLLLATGRYDLKIDLDRSLQLN